MADDDENKERRAEELDALRSFYGDNLLSGDETCPASWRIRISKNVTLEMIVPPSYPSDDAPFPVIRHRGRGKREERRGGGEGKGKRRKRRRRKEVRGHKCTLSIKDSI